MAIEHKDIPDANRHEPKGTEFASPGEVLVASTGPSTGFRYLEQADIQDLPYIPALNIVEGETLVDDGTGILVARKLDYSEIEGTPPIPPFNPPLNSVEGEVMVDDGTGTLVVRKLDYPEITNPPLIPSAFVVTDFLAANDYTDQVSNVIGNVQGVLFGPAAVSAGGNISVDANGVFTVASPGTYLMKVVLAPGRTTGVNSSQIFIRGLIDGTPTTSTRSVTMNDSGVSSVGMITESFLSPQTAGTTISFEQLLDSNGGGDTGLMSASPVSQPWADSPSTSAVVYKLGIA